MSKEEEVKQITALLDEAKEKIELVKEKGGKYQRALRTYKKAVDSLASDDMRRCSYFHKRSLEQIEREYEKLSDIKEEPEEEESVEEPEIMQDDDNDMSWDEESEKQVSSGDDPGMDLPPPPPDMMEEGGGSGAIEEEKDEFFDLSVAVEEKSAEKKEAKKTILPEEESDELFDFWVEEDKKTPIEPEEVHKPREPEYNEENEEIFDFDEVEERKKPAKPEESPEPSTEEEAEELFDFDGAGGNDYDDEPEERSAISPEDEESVEYFDFGEGESEYPPDPVETPEPTPDEEAEELFDFDGAEENEYPDAPEESDNIPDQIPDEREKDEEQEEDERVDAGDDKKISEEIKAVREAIESAPSFMDLSEVKELLEDAELKLQSRDHIAAGENIEKCKNELDVLRKEYKEASGRFEEAKEMLKKANELGVGIAQAKELLKQAKEHLNSGEISEMRKLSDRCIEELTDEMMEPLTREKMLGLKMKILEYKNAGVNIKSAAEVFNTAGILMKERNFKQVMELAAKSEAMADKSKTEFDLNNLLNAMENGFEQMKEKDDNLTDIGKDIERARELQKDGEMEKAHELAVDTEKNLRKILEPMVEERLNRLDSTIESSEKTIYVNEEKEERDLAKDAVDQGNFVEAFNLIATALRNLDQSKKNSYPLITLRFADMELKENVWNRAKVILKNTGKAHATGIKVELIGPVVVRRLKPISHLNAKEEKEVEIAVRFDGGGSVPVDVEMTYKSAVDGNEHETRDGLWIDVGPVAHKSNKPKHGPTGGEDRKGAPVIVPGKISRCKICLGVIKKPSMLYECGCGRKYHKSCITRVEECPSCSLPAQDM